MTPGHLVRRIAITSVITLGIARTTSGQTAVVDPWKKGPLQRGDRSSAEAVACEAEGTGQGEDYIFGEARVPAFTTDAAYAEYVSSIGEIPAFRSHANNTDGQARRNLMTDNVGSAAGNLALSEDRAAAVKGALVAEFGVDGNRITTKGLGDTKPSVPDTTRAGRAQNRRVEVVKK